MLTTLSQLNDTKELIERNLTLQLHCTDPSDYEQYKILKKEAQSSWHRQNESY